MILFSVPKFREDILGCMEEKYCSWIDTLFYGGERRGKKYVDQ